MYVLFTSILDFKFLRSSFVANHYTIIPFLFIINFSVCVWYMPFDEWMWVCWETGYRFQYMVHVVWYLAITSLNSVSTTGVFFGFLFTENVILASFWLKSWILIYWIVFWLDFGYICLPHTLILVVFQFAWLVHLILPLFVLGVLSQAFVSVHFAFQLSSETSSWLPLEAVASSQLSVVAFVYDRAEFFF